MLYTEYVEQYTGTAAVGACCCTRAILCSCSKGVARRAETHASLKVLTVQGKQQMQLTIVVLSAVRVDVAV